jgi:hypothetical protein
MNNCLRWGEFELPILLGILRDYLPRKTEFHDDLIEGETDYSISLDDIEIIGTAILEAFEDGVDVERLTPLVPRATMMLEEVARLKLDDAPD